MSLFNKSILYFKRKKKNMQLKNATLKKSTPRYFLINLSGLAFDLISFTYFLFLFVIKCFNLNFNYFDLSQISYLLYMNEQKKEKKIYKKTYRSDDIIHLH